LFIVSHSVIQARVAVAEARAQFGNPEERERLPLEAVIRRLDKIKQAEKAYVLAQVICEVCKRVKS
jgi:hypothetical protein